MTGNKWVRQVHRWVAVFFTVTVLATVVALAREEPVVWVSYTPLFPLALLFCTGAYLFLVPYLPRARRSTTGGRRGR